MVCSRFFSMSGTPADRSLLSSTTQGSKLSSTRRLFLRCRGSSVSEAPFGSASLVGWVISGSMLPMRTFMPACFRMRASLATFCR